MHSPQMEQVVAQEEEEEEERKDMKVMLVMKEASGQDSDIRLAQCPS